MKPELMIARILSTKETPLRRGMEYMMIAEPQEYKCQETNLSAADLTAYVDGRRAAIENDPAKVRILADLIIREPPASELAIDALEAKLLVGYQPQIGGHLDRCAPCERYVALYTGFSEHFAGNRWVGSRRMDARPDLAAVLTALSEGRLKRWRNFDDYWRHPPAPVSE